jgi:uncharacterized DUF497 family protein
MVQLFMTENIRKKLESEHGVQPTEVFQCFLNREKGFLLDDREEHKTDPPTQWFISNTDAGRFLKVVFIRTSATEIDIKSAYEPNSKEITIYKTKAPSL